MILTVAHYIDFYRGDSMQEIERSDVEMEDARISHLLKTQIDAFDTHIFSHNPIPVITITDNEETCTDSIMGREDGANFSFSRILARSAMGRLKARLLRKPDQYCYSIIEPGASAFLQRIMANSPILIDNRPQRLTASEHAFLVGIAAHEVRHRLQYEHREHQLFDPFCITPIRPLHSQALFFLTRREMYTDDVRLRLKEFDAAMVEALVEYVVIQHGVVPRGIEAVITSSPQTINGIMQSLASQLPAKG